MKTIEQAANEDSGIRGNQSCKSMKQFIYDNGRRDGFIAGVEFAQQWIPIEEELPPINKYVLLRYSEGELCVGVLNVYGYYCSPYSPKENEHISIHLLSEVTHWRPIELK